MAYYRYGNHASPHCAIRLGENERLLALSVCLAGVTALRIGCTEP